MLIGLSNTTPLGQAVCWPIIIGGYGYSTWKLYGLIHATLRQRLFELCYALAFICLVVGVVAFASHDALLAGISLLAALVLFVPTVLLNIRAKTKEWKST
jgi:H+/Cl- antiporter ClcA